VKTWSLTLEEHFSFVGDEWGEVVQLDSASVATKPTSTWWDFVEYLNIDVKHKHGLALHGCQCCSAHHGWGDHRRQTHQYCRSRPTLNCQHRITSLLVPGWQCTLPSSQAGLQVQAAEQQWCPVSALRSLWVSTESEVCSTKWPWRYREDILPPSVS